MKNIKYLLLLFIIILISGCGADGGAAKLEQALENMSKISSAKIETEMNVAIEGYNIVMVIEEVVSENGESYTKNSTKMLGQENYNETYVIKNDDKILVYSGVNGKEWTYKMYDNVGMNNNSTPGGISSFASNYKSVKEVNSDIKGHTKLEVTIDKNEMAKKLDGEVGDVKFKLAKDLVMDVYIKDDYITKIKFNFEDSLQTSEDGTKTKYSFEFNISEHNNISDINVPQEILEQAKEASE